MTAEAELEAERAKIKKIRADIKKVTEKADEYCNEIKAATEATASQTLHTAQDRADAIVNDAKQQARIEVESVQATVGALRKQRDTLQQSILDHDAQHKALVQKIAESEAKLADVQDRIRNMLQ